MVFILVINILLFCNWCFIHTFRLPLETWTLINGAASIITNALLYLVYMGLCGCVIFEGYCSLLYGCPSQSGWVVPKSTGETGWSGNGPEIQWNLTSMFPLDVKMKCNTDINVASITTQQRNVNWSTGTSGWTLTSCSRTPPPSYKPEILLQWPARFRPWLFITVGPELDQNGSFWRRKESGYSSREEAEMIVEINHFSWWFKGSCMYARVQQEPFLEV